MRKISLFVVSMLLVAAMVGTAGFAAEPAKGEATPAAGAPATPEKKAEVAPPPKPKTFIEDRVAKVGDEPIDFSLFDVTGNNLVNFADLQKKSKKILALVFLNSTCASCVNEAELMASMKKKYQNDLLLVAVVTDMNPKLFENSASENVKSSFDVIHDPKFSIPPSYGFAFTPGLVLIKGNKIVAVKGGFIPGKDDKEVVDLVKNNM